MRTSDPDGKGRQVIDAAEQRLVGDAGVQAAAGAGRERARECGEEAVADGAGAGAEAEAAEAAGVDREEVEREAGAGPGLGGFGHGRISSTTRITRDGRAGLVERVAAQAVAHGGGGEQAELLAADAGRAVVGGEGAGGADEGQLAAQAVGAEGDAEGGAVAQGRVGDLDGAEAVAGGEDRLPQAGVGGAPALHEGGVVGFVGVAAADHLDAVVDVGGRRDLDREAEAVEELGAELALLGVAGADEDEAGGMADREALALDDVLARGGDVEEEVDDVVLEQIDLVDVEIAAVGAGQQAGLKGFFAAGEGALDVEGADDAVLGGAEGEVDDGGRALDDVAGGELGPGGDVGVGGAVDRAAGDGADVGQEGGEGADGGGLAGAAVAEDEHAADAGVDGGQDERALHLLLADDGGEGKGLHHAQRAIGWGRASGLDPPQEPASPITWKRA